MLENIGSALVSIFSGGFTGLLGAGMQLYFQLQVKKLDVAEGEKKRAHEIEMRRVDSELAQQEAAAALEVTREETRQGEERSRSEDFRRSIDSDIESERTLRVLSESEAGEAAVGNDGKPKKKRVLSRFGSFVTTLVINGRASMRPFLALYWTGLLTVVYFNCRHLMGKEFLTPVQVNELMKLIVGTVLYLCTTTTLWYFGVRNAQKPPKTR